MKERMKLPDGWVSEKLGNVCQTTSGGTPSRKNPDYYIGSIPWVKSGELDRGLIVDTEEKISEAAIKNSSAKIFPQGTLLIALYGATIGKLGFLGTDAATNQAICGIFKNEILDLEFLRYYLFNNRHKLIEQGAGGAQPNISQTILKNLDVVIPPLPEQHRIVAAIEALFTSLDRGIASLKTAQQQLKIYRQAVLKWAFEGKLTNEEVKDGELPEGWKWVKLGDVSEMCLGKMLDKTKNKGDFQPYLRNINVRWGHFNLSDLEMMKFEESESERYGLKQGDLIICEGGEPGRAAVWVHSQPIKIQKALHRVRLNQDFDPKYFYYFMFFAASIGQLEQYFTGTTIKHLTGKELKKVIFPAPSLSEQHQIVAAIESRLSVCDKLEETILQSLQQAEALRQSILKKAFAGQLVPQDPNDEPASVLLERIRAERAASSPHKNHKNHKHHSQDQ